MEAVFKALSDPTRRKILDALRRRDGQSLGEIEERFEMTRFGVMKHLRVLEEAGLVVTRRVGRKKLHYLNPVPIQRIVDRWISKYARPWTEAMAELKHTLEGRMAQAPRHIYEIYIRTTPERLWKAITDPSMTEKYFYGTRVDSDWRAGSEIRYLEGKNVPVAGRVVEIDPPRKLVTTFSMLHDEEAAKDRPSRVTWLIEPTGDICKLTVVHDDFDGETKTFRNVSSGWNPILSGLKTYLETGSSLFPAAVAEQEAK